jgi:hypothetical protein
MRKSLNRAERARLACWDRSEQIATGQMPRAGKAANCNHLQDGILACRFLTQDERAWSTMYLALLRAEFRDVPEIDDDEVRYVLLLHVQLARAWRMQKARVFCALGRDIRGHLRTLQAAVTRHQAALTAGWSEGLEADVGPSHPLAAPLIAYATAQGCDLQEIQALLTALG